MGSAPPMLLIGTAVVLLGNLLHIIGLGSTHWVEVDSISAGGISIKVDGHSGLFRTCSKDDCADYKDPSSKLEAVQAMVIIGMLCGLVGAAAALIYVIFKLLSKSTSKIMTLACAGACVAAFVFIIIGIIIFAADLYESDHQDLGYSFALCIVGGILLAVGGVLVFVGGKSVE